MLRVPAYILLAVAMIGASEASAMIFPPIAPAPAPTTTQTVAGAPKLLPPAAMQGVKNALPAVTTGLPVPVYSTFALPPPKPPKPSPIYVPDSQNLSRRRHLGW